MQIRAPWGQNSFTRSLFVLLIYQIGSFLALQSRTGANKNLHYKNGVFIFNIVFSKWLENGQVFNKFKQQNLWVKMIFLSFYSSESCNLLENTPKWFGGLFGTW